MNVGIFGGTFDPPHCGHLIVAQDAALALGLDRILFVPAAQPPHKRDRVVTAADVRARMLQLAIVDDDRFDLDTLELERAGPSYTVDTLRQLTQRHAGAEWTLLMGVDQYAEFDTWREPAAIRRMVRLGVLSRSGLRGGSDGLEERDTAAPALHRLQNGDVELDVTRIDISSTAIRRRVAAGQSIRYLVPPPVEAFIREAGLYRRNGPVVAG